MYTYIYTSTHTYAVACSNKSKDGIVLCYIYEEAHRSGEDHTAKAGERGGHLPAVMCHRFPAKITYYIAQCTTTWVRTKQLAQLYTNIIRRNCTFCEAFRKLCSSEQFHLALTLNSIKKYKKKRSLRNRPWRPMCLFPVRYEQYLHIKK
jgi:hypothetical protein